MATKVPVTLELSEKGANALVGSLNRVASGVSKIQRSQVSAVAIGTALGNVITRTARQAVAFGREALTTADSIAKNSRAVGLASDEYQRIQFAAKRSGVAFREAQVGIQTMQRAIDRGLPAVERLGLNLDDLRKMSPAKQFTEVGQALRGIENPAARTSIAMDIFGRQGARVAQMAGDFQALSGEADRLGVIINDGALASAEKFNDMMGDIKLQIQAAFVNTLPDIRLFGETAIAEIRRILAVSGLLGESIVDAFANKEAVPVAKNVGKIVGASVLDAILSNPLTGAGAIRSAFRFAKGQDAFEPSNILGGVTTDATRTGERFTSEMEKINAEHAQRIESAVDSHSKSFERAAADIGDVSSATANAAVRISATRGVGAASRGSVEAASAIARFQSQSRDTLERQQLAELRGLRTDIRNLDLSIEEYAIP